MTVTRLRNVGHVMPDILERAARLKAELESLWKITTAQGTLIAVALIDGIALPMEFTGASKESCNQEDVE